jgi:hypothetical protein
LLAELLADLAEDETGEEIGPAAGRIGDDDPHGPRGVIGLGESRPGRERRGRGNGGEADEDVAAGQSHEFLPGTFVLRRT